MENKIEHYLGLLTKINQLEREASELRFEITTGLKKGETIFGKFRILKSRVSRTLIPRHWREAFWKFTFSVR